MNRTLALTTLLAFASTPAFAGGTCEIEGLGGASEYNVVTLGDYTATGSDIGGKAAIGGDMNVSGYGIGDGLSTGAGTVLSVGGDLTATNGQVYNGDAEVGGDCFTTTSWNILDGTQSCNDSGAFDASSLTDEMRDLSAYLSGLTATHGTKAFATGTVELTGTGDEIVFDLDLDDVKAGFYSYVTTIRNVAITAPEGSTVIINVTGDTTILFQSMGVSLGGGVKASTIVWNFGTATSVTANGVEPKGALLAPYAHFEFDNGQMYGTAIVASFDGNGEFHETLFGGEICTPPEGDPCPYDDADNALGPAGAYNVFTFDDFDGKYSDIEGKAAIGGTAKFLHYGIASGESGGDTVLSVYGNAEISNSQIYGGDGEVGGTCVTSSLGTPDGSLTCGLGTSVFNTGDHEDDIGDLSDYLADLADTGTTTVYDWGVVDLDAGSDDLQVFNLDLSAIKTDMAWSSKIYTLNIDADSDQTVVINVTGDTSVMMNSMGFSLTGGVGYEDIVFHYPDATALTVKSVTVPGALLAPKAALSFDWGNIEGTVVTKSVKGTGEFHTVEFEGEFCPTSSSSGSGSSR